MKVKVWEQQRTILQPGNKRVWKHGDRVSFVLAALAFAPLHAATVQAAVPYPYPTRLLSSYPGQAK